ncbi:MAG: homoserine dehydrogenase [Lentisphaerae bacterium]|jgi:homoserine dehydrogenase|nr:homoserine dehydrogenase [Lentisphaerota bacterium]
MKQIGVGLLGFGTVGAGVVDGLQRNRALLSDRLGVDIVMRRIADLDITTSRGVTVAPGVLTTDSQAVIADPGVDIVVELIGGTGAARKLMMAALEAGKPVVTANKKLLAEHGEEIFALAHKRNVDIYFGASVGGGIPIVRVLREGLVGNAVVRIHGILNGTCNYILTRMEREGLPFDEVLAEAQRLGYAEADPALDIDGFDTAHKAAILTLLSYGFHVPMDSLPIEGIRGLDGVDVQYARELGYRIKLLATVARVGNAVEVRVGPTLVPLHHMLASVAGVFNAVMVRGDMSGDTLYYGRGAGREPTASTVIGDIADIARNLRTNQPRHVRTAQTALEKPRLCTAEEMRSAFYLRLMVKDQAGSLGRFTSILGKHGVSIAAVMQKAANGAGADGFVPVVALTHSTPEASLNAALDEITASGVVSTRPVSLRMLEE